MFSSEGFLVFMVFSPVGGSLVATSIRTRELGEKEMEVVLLRADVLVSLERKRWKFGCDEQTNS